MKIIINAYPVEFYLAENDLIGGEESKYYDIILDNPADQDAISFFEENIPFDLFEVVEIPENATDWAIHYEENGYDYVTVTINGRIEQVN